MLLVACFGEKLPLKPHCSHSAQLCDLPGGNQGGDIASPFLSFKHFWWESDRDSLGILTTSKLQTAEEMLGKHHLSEIKALEETGVER